MLKTWNDRINPYDSSKINDSVMIPIRKFIVDFNLSIFIFDKWKYKPDSTRYNLKHNDRPFVYSPFNALIMGWWLKIFPFGKWSLEFEMLFFTIFSIFLVILYVRKKHPDNLKSIAIISIISSPVLFKIHYPSFIQLNMLLFALPIMLFLLYPSKNFRTSFLYGIIYGFCFYVNLTVFFFLIFLVSSFLFYAKDLTFKYILGLIAGILVPIIIFTASGYYFWLTFITGRFFSQYFALHYKVSFMENITKLLYFGPSFLLLFILLLININKLEKRIFPLFIPCILSVFFMIFFYYDQNGWNRYLSQFIPTILLFILSIDNVIILKKRDLFVFLLANYIFIQFNMYY